MKALVLGSTGMLGRALVSEGKKRGFVVYEMAKDGADFAFDVVDDEALETMIFSVVPDLIINTVAIIDHNFCEKNPSIAYLVNTRPVSIITRAAKKINSYFVQISTDHFFTGDGDKKHAEDAPVSLVNEYARTKYLAEMLALHYEKALIIRTNIIGFRYEKDRPTFAEWVLRSFKKTEEMTLFYDYFTSSIDVTNFSKILFDVIAKKTTGLLNVACRDVVSKKEFIQTMAKCLQVDLSLAHIGSVRNLHGAQRAESAGLDVEKVENLLGYKLPAKDIVVNDLIKECRMDLL